MLKIEEGKYYETADGVRVGPMYMWSAPGKHQVEHPWQSGERNMTYAFSRFGDIWRNDGTSFYGMPTLVREVP
jgi:hypothetical protein